MFMWLIEFVLGSLPVWLWPFMTGCSVGIYFLAGIAGNFPAIRPYATFIRPVSFLVFCFSIFMFGGAGVESANQALIKAAEEKVRLAEESSKTANDQLESKLKDAHSQIKEQEDRLASSILRNKKKFDAECVISPAALKMYNRAVTNTQAIVPKK